MNPLTVTLQGFNKKGWGRGSCEKSEIEVIGGLPGDSVLAEPLGRKRRGVQRARLQEVVAPSPLRVTPRCIHAPSCGGCAWQQMDYSAQLQEKQRRIQALFPPDKCLPIVPAEDPWHYRNKMEFSFSQNKAGERFLGLVLAGSKGHVFNLTECHLVSSWYASLLCSIRSWWEESGLLAYRRDNTGSLRTLTVREGKRTGDKLVMLTVSGDPAYRLCSSQLKSFVEAALRGASEPAKMAIFLQIQQTCPGQPTQWFEMHLAGPTHLTERLDLPEPLLFAISPTSFFQPHTAQAERLYRLALSQVTFPKRLVFDLYAGMATLGMAMALRSDRVISIEINPHACFDAEANRERNQLNNLEILCGDVGNELEKWRAAYPEQKADLVVLDPPRAGLDPQALKHVLGLLPQEILYISCNPQTQAPNIQALVLAGYELVSILPVDQFPHTVHIETIALLRRADFA